MEEKKEITHSLHLEQRGHGLVTGVTEMKSFDEENIFMETSQGTLAIRGSSLHVCRLELEKGEAEIEGKVDSLIYTQGRKEKKKDKDNDSIEVPEIQFMQMNAKISSSLDVYKPLRFSFAEPLQTYDAGKIHLEQKRDTLWIPVADSLYTFLQDSIAIRDYTLTYKWTPGESYRIVMDSTAFTNIYGLFTNTYKQEFKVKALEDYANLYLSISGVSDSAFVEILDSGDKPVRTAPVINGGAEFMYMNPGTYYARLFIDRNGNGKYDTGNYSEKRQPEEVSYYPQELELKANWDIEQDWDIYATPVDKQKPDKIKKNKPKEKKRNY